MFDEMAAAKRHLQELAGQRCSMAYHADMLAFLIKRVEQRERELFDAQIKHVECLRHIKEHGVIVCEIVNSLRHCMEELRRDHRQPAPSLDKLSTLLLLLS